MSTKTVTVLVTPEDCDAFGSLGASGLGRVLERARWHAFDQPGGPAADVFTNRGLRPAVRKLTLEQYEDVAAGEWLSVETALTQQAETSFTVHQTARRVADNTLVGEGDCYLVCYNLDDVPARLPDEVSGFFGTRPSVRPGMTQHLAVNGTATAVDIHGDGPSLLFIHGFPFDRTMWRHLMATLTGWRRVAPDLRGMGLSDVAGRGYFMSDYADDMVRLLDILKIDQTVVAGLSMGGYVAFEMFRRYPDRIRALILVHTRAEADDEAGRAARDQMIATAEREGPAAIADAMLPKLLGASTIQAMPRVVEHVRTMIAGTGVEGMVGALEAMKRRRDSRDLLPTIDVPTLVVAGSDDQIMPAKSMKKMAAKIPEAQFIVIPESAHLSPLEQPIALGRVVGEFLDAL